MLTLADYDNHIYHSRQEGLSIAQCPAPLTLMAIETAAAVQLVGMQQGKNTITFPALLQASSAHPAKTLPHKTEYPAKR